MVSIAQAGFEKKLLPLMGSKDLYGLFINVYDSSTAISFGRLKN